LTAKKLIESEVYIMPGTNLKLVFKGASDKKLTFTYPDANGAATATQVKTLMQNIIANKEIFAEQPLVMDSATFVTTTSVPVDLS